MKRLETIYPGMTGLVENASSSTKLRVILMICSAAIEAADIKNKLVDSSLSDLSQNGLLTLEARQDLDSLRDSLDDEYFKYQESGSNELSLRRFRQARAVAALAYAGDISDRGSILDAIYEAFSALDNSDSFAEMICSELAGG